MRTAGQQRYYEFIQERIKRFQTGRVVWVSLLAVAFIAAFSDIKIAAFLALAGIVMAVVNTNAKKTMDQSLAAVEDQESFFLQLTAPDVKEYSDCHVLVSKDYVLVDQATLWILRFRDMEKIEVGKHGDVKKTLFLTDRDGNRHEIVSCTKGDGMQETFDEIYTLVRGRLHAAQEMDEK